MSGSWIQTFTAFPGIWSSYDAFHRQKYAKASPSHFAKWYSKQDQCVIKRIRPLKQDPRWAILKCTADIWADKAASTLYAKPHVRKYVICIDPKSCYAGNIYLYEQNSKLVIYSKFAMSIPWRPIHLVAKTFYHLALIGVAKAIFNQIKQKENLSNFSKRIVRTLMDTLRTPLYESILLIIAIVTLVSVPFKPTLIYDLRALTAQITTELNWGARLDMPYNMTPCMLRVGNIMNYELNPQHQKKNPNINYPENITLAGLANLAYR